jgi:hypothetical protein
MMGHGTPEQGDGVARQAASVGGSVQPVISSARADETPASFIVTSLAAAPAVYEAAT